MMRSLVLVPALLLCLSLGAHSPATAQPILINEFMASNDRTLADEDGDYPDWIELFNAGDEAVDLSGYSLTDDPEQPDRWSLPSLVLSPGKHLLIFASGKDRTGSAGEWHTLIDQGHEVLYYVGSTSPGFNWRSRTFDDSSWIPGPTPIGYERDASGADLATTVPFGTTSLYVRIRFDVADPQRVQDALLHVDYDDGFVAYLNNGEIARGNMPASSAPPAHTALAPANHEAVIYQGGYPERFAVPDVGSRLNSDGNVLALQVHNVSAESSDLTLIPFLTLAFGEEVPDGPGPSPHLPDDMNASAHTNFSLDADGEFIVLRDPQGQVVDSIAFAGQRLDQSMGRKPDGSSEWMWFVEPTPAGPNHTEGYAGAELSPPLFSLPAGKYPAATQIALTSPDDAVIHYTTDGSLPTTEDATYSAPLALTQTTVIRARAFQPGTLPSTVTTQTFLVNENASVPVLSLATDPPNLWDHETGIYANGPGWTPEYPHFGANFWQEWEIPMSVEFFEPDGSRVIAQEAGARIYGAWSRARPQKSLALFARGRYGADRFRHRIWASRNLDSFVSLVLRNSGNDWNQLHFLDAFMQALAEGLDIETLAFRPSHVYLNGEYWGVLNLREKANEYMVGGKHGVDFDTVDLLEMTTGAIALEGTLDHYNALVAYLQSNDITRPEVYEHVRTQLEINSFIDYNAFQIYVANTDWPGNNNKFWRPRTPDGRYRWILFDTDFGFGANNSYNHATLPYATAANGPAWPNPPAATLLLRELLKNDDFKYAFINRFADLLNHHLDPDRVRRIMDEMAPEVEREVPRQFARWGGNMNNWRNQRAARLDFGSRRHAFFWGHLRSFFGLPTQLPVSVNVDYVGRGRVRVNRLLPQEYPWTGRYLPGVPLQIEAVARPGHRFVRWSGTSSSTNPLLVIDPADRHDLTAHFEVDSSVPAPLSISEIQYHPPDDHPSGDWIELYNPMPFDVDLSGWTFRDEGEDHVFVFPDGTLIGGRGFLVVAEDPTAFASLHPDVPELVGGWDFALANGGEAIILRDAVGATIDSLTYDDDAPWPSDPDGNGPTVELTDLAEDNTVPSHWQSSQVRGGSPGAFNTVGVRVDVEDETPVLPESAELAPVYPNPFRDVAIISFGLPRSSHVNLQVYNVLGQVVETVVDAQMQPGTHTTEWVASGAAPGIYFLRLMIDGASAGSVSAVLIR